MSHNELYFAILTGTEFEDIFLGNPLDVDIDDVHRFILSSSKGLAEITKTTSPVVQFIHESMRDFLLKDDGMGQVWPDLEENPIGTSHDQLKACCYTYIRRVIQFDSGLMSRKLRFERFKSRFPFSKYAVDRLLLHAESAHSQKVSQEVFIKEFEIEKWITINDFVERYEIRAYQKSVSLLYILAEKKCASLLNLFPNRELCFWET